MENKIIINSKIKRIQIYFKYSNGSPSAYGPTTCAKYIQKEIVLCKCQNMNNSTLNKKD